MRPATCKSAVLLVLLALPGSASEAQNRDWSVYLGDAGRRHYSPLEQITRGNVAGLEVAWTYDSGALRRGNSTMYTSPLVVDGVLYGLSPRLVAFALDAATGAELWRYDPGLDGAPQRGLMWWERETDGGTAARLFYTADNHLVALDPAAGLPVVDFGDGGVLDLAPPDAAGPLRVTVPGIVFEDLIVLGFSTSEGADALPGAISAYSALDGSLVWRHHNVPRPGEPGAETWADGALEVAGGANTWTGMALDAERGLLFAPTGSATPDFYGASRVGDNLYANSLLAIDVRTGELRWHFQTVRHDVWDRDLPSPPTLVRFDRGGDTIDAVAVTTKSGHLFVFDRETGEPLFDVGEVTAHPSALPGEVVVTRQPESSIALTRQRFEMTTRSPEAIDFVRAIHDRLDRRPWAPPSLQGTLMYPGYDGGAEWGGSAFDPATGRLIVNSSEIGAILRLYEIPAGFSARGLRRALRRVPRRGPRRQRGRPRPDRRRRPVDRGGDRRRRAQRTGTDDRFRPPGRNRDPRRDPLRPEPGDGRGPAAVDRGGLRVRRLHVAPRPGRPPRQQSAVGHADVRSIWPPARSTGRCRSGTIRGPRARDSARRATGGRW